MMSTAMLVAGTTVAKNVFIKEVGKKVLLGAIGGAVSASVNNAVKKK